MHIPTLLLSLVLSTAVVANGKGNKTEKGLSTEDTCKEMRGLQSLITLASNTTELDNITKDNATKIAEIQAKASGAATKLQTLQWVSPTQYYVPVSLARSSHRIASRLPS
jgi:hypothetical protein